MKKLIPLLLIWLTFSSISILENIWKNSKIAIPYRIDLFNNEGILFREDLLPIRKENPDWDICGEIETYGKLTLDINNNVGISVLAVSPDYLKYNPVNIIRGDFFLDGALIIQRDAAYNHFNTDDIVGDVLLFNDEPHIVAGIYDFSPLMKELSPCLPDVIVSINNTTINKNNISLLQIVSGSKINAGELNPYLNVPGQKNLELNLRFQLLKQLKNFLYIPLGILIIISLLKISCNDILERRQIYRDNHLKYYRFQSIKLTLKYKTYVYLFIISLLIAVLILLLFK
ncbi:MAG: ABC transporter permease, partial [Deltaproteobacteria bacterium]|nr:ABC transporter permease [Deltaproteobacteria bacterium]